MLVIVGGDEMNLFVSRKKTKARASPSSEKLQNRTSSSWSYWLLIREIANSDPTAPLEAAGASSPKGEADAPNP